MTRMHFIAIFLMSYIDGQAIAQENYTLQGSVVFWERSCQGDVCELPHALTDRLPIRVDITAPQTGASFVNETITTDRFSLEMLFVFRRAETDYFVIQSIVREDGNRSWACSQYHGIQEGWFPSGFCSKSTVTGEVGVSFYKN